MFSDDNASVIGRRRGHFRLSAEPFNSELDQVEDMVARGAIRRFPDPDKHSIPLPKRRLPVHGCLTTSFAASRQGKSYRLAGAARAAGYGR